MKNLFKICVLSIVFCLLFSCGSDTEKKEQEQLPDSLFVFHDLENSLLVNHFWYDEKDNYKMYTDSTKQKYLIGMDSVQKMKYVVPILGIDTSYVIQYMSAAFVSKQKMIGDLQPIIVWVNGDDYESLIYILLDKTLKPVSHLVLFGGEHAGPVDEFEDGTLQYPTLTHSFLKGDEIKWYALIEYVKPDTIDHPSTFDSINYLSKILPTGEITTKRLDSIRFERVTVED